MQSDTPILVSLLPFEFEGSRFGHNLEYIKAIHKSAEKLGWKHYAPTSARIGLEEPLPFVVKCLKGSRRVGAARRLGVGSRLIDWVRGCAIPSIKSLGQWLKDLTRRENRHCIVFVETFGPPELFVIAAALAFVPRRRVSLWLLYRFSNYKRPLFGFIYELMNRIIDLRLGRGRLCLLTDSDALAESLAKRFGRPLTVMPIPHTEMRQSVPHPKVEGETVLWWPGQPRPEKGLDKVQKLLSSRHPATDRIRLVITKSSRVVSPDNGISVTLTEDYLGREDYLKWLATADIVLLPYSAEVYAEQTSGIFVEAISAGKMALVTAETWMARELARHDLRELVANWDGDVVERVLEISQNPQIHRRVKEMSRAYQQFHNAEVYASRMEMLYRTVNRR